MASECLNFRFFSALVELLNPIKLTKKIQPVKLSTDCGFDVLDQEVEAISAGLGRVDPYTRNTDARLRHTDLVTKPTSDCLREPIRPMDAFAITCANITDGRSVSHGDSGGPLIRASDSTLLGVVSFGYLGSSRNNGKGLQVFGFVPHYYKWIEHVTGLKMPECQLPQAIVF